MLYEAEKMRKIKMLQKPSFKIQGYIIPLSFTEKLKIIFLITI